MLISEQLSDKGRTRVEKNLKNIRQILNEIDGNIDITKQNIQTLHKESAELESLEKKHLGLQKKYMEYLDKAKKEKIATEKKYSKLKSQPQNSKEAIELELWVADTKQKVQKAETLLVEVRANLKEISIKRKWVHDQLGGWQVKLPEFEKQRKDAEEKQAQMEALLKKKNI
jgi:chromosome segregation ATPase